MKEIMIEALQGLLITLSLGVVGVLGAYGKKFLTAMEMKVNAETDKIKGDNERALIKSNLERVFELTKNVVAKAETTIVAEIKEKSEDGYLTKEEGKKILEVVTAEISGQLTQESKDVISKSAKDVDLYIKELVERVLAEITGKI